MMWVKNNGIPVVLQMLQTQHGDHEHRGRRYQSLQVAIVEHALVRAEGASPCFHAAEQCWLRHEDAMDDWCPLQQGRRIPVEDVPS